TYTNLGIDSSSYNTTRSRLNPFPSNFCLFDRKNIVDALREIAYQSRCAIWLNNGTFYFRYLPSEPSAVDTIDISDIIHNSIRLENTSTESITTKMTCAYQTD